MARALHSDGIMELAIVVILLAVGLMLERGGAATEPIRVRASRRR